jgi:drug/metabolite transporter (DMT)-like permease
VILLKRGYVYSIISAVLFGSAGLIVKLAFLEGTDPIGLLTLQYIIAVTIMFSVIYMKNKRMLRISGNELYHLIILGVVGNTFMTVFYYMSYNYLPMAMVTILLYTYPIMVFIYLFLFRRRSINIKKTMALAYAFVGCILALGAFNSNFKYSSKGIVFGLLAAVFYAFMNIYSENRLGNVQSLTINAYSTLFSLISLIIFRFPLLIFKGEIRPKIIAYTAVLAVLCEIVPLTLMYAALKRIGSLKVSIIGNIETPTAMLLSFLILKENISLIQIVGAALVFYGVYIIRK